MRKYLTLLAALFGGQVQGQSLPATLAEIEVLIAEKRPELSASLNEPLSLAQISALEAEYGVTLPADLRALYVWHNGQNQQRFDVFADNMQFLPLENALRVKAELDGMIGYDFELENWWNANWFPVFDNGAGNYVAVDSQGVHTGNAGQLVLFYHDWEKRTIVAGDMTSYFHGVLRYYRSTAAEDMDEFHALDEHLPSTGRSFKAAGSATPLE